MRNRAKCKLCGDIIESLYINHLVSCKCNEISLDGGQSNAKMLARNWDNFLIVDDNDAEIAPIFKDSDQLEKEKPKQLDMFASEPDSNKFYSLEQWIKRIEELPQHAKEQPATHYDLYSLASMVLSVLRDT